MKTTRNWLKYGIVGTLLLTMACSAALILQVLTSQSNIKAGIATFRFNFTGLMIADNSILAKRVSEPNIIQSLQSGVQSVATSVATAIPGAVSQIQSAAGTLTTAIPDSIEALIPQNLSLGTKEFCVGLSHNVSCGELPFNLSNLVLIDVEKYLQPDLSDIGSLNSALAKIMPLDLYDSLIRSQVNESLITSIFEILHLFSSLKLMGRASS